MIDPKTWSERTLVIDNYDSFTWNLVHLLEFLDASPIVVRPSELEGVDLSIRPPARLVISPGPGRPSNSPISLRAVKACTGTIPVLGVCLGAQCIGEAFGGSTVRAPLPRHGKTSAIEHDGSGCFRELPSRIDVMRYHSLMTCRRTLPAVLAVTATTDDGIPMAIRHRTHRTEGLQFHPESFLTSHGRKMIENFLSW